MPCALVATSAAVALTSVGARERDSRAIPRVVAIEAVIGAAYDARCVEALERLVAAAEPEAVVPARDLQPRFA